MSVDKVSSSSSLLSVPSTPKFYMPVETQVCNGFLYHVIDLSVMTVFSSSEYSSIDGESASKCEHVVVL